MLSVAVTVNVTAAPDGPVASALIDPGAVRAGGVLSVRTTVALKLAVPVLPCPSVAEQGTTGVPTLKCDPEGGEHVTGTEPETASVAVPSGYVTVVPLGSSVSTDTSAGGVTTGGGVSTTRSG